MDSATKAMMDSLRSSDGDERYAAYMAALKATDEPVDWAYEVWDELLANLRHKDAHQRAIATQLLCNLAKSDPKQRMLRDFDAVLAVTRDPKFVTARHTLQALWKVGAVGPQHQALVVGRLAERFADCVDEKNFTLIRSDILQGLRNLYDQLRDETIRAQALALIESVDDQKYRKKYMDLWRV